MNGKQSDVLLTENENPSSTPTAANEGEGRAVAPFLAIGLAVAAGVIRLIPHPWNFTPVAALGLFGGARLRLWQAVTLPLLVMVVTDFLIWEMKGWSPFNLSVYGCFAVNVLLGLLLRSTKSWLRIGTASVAASVLFFLVTNFTVWQASRLDPQELPAGSGMMRQTEGSKYPEGRIRYADNARGLLTCYYMGLNFSTKDAWPLGFAGNLLAGNLFFTGLLFGVQAVAARRSGPAGWKVNYNNASGERR